MNRTKATMTAAAASITGGAMFMHWAPIAFCGGLVVGILIAAAHVKRPGDISAALVRHPQSIQLRNAIRLDRANGAPQ